MRFPRLAALVGLIALLSAGAFAQTSNLWRPQPNPTPPPCPQIRQFYNVSGAFQQIDCNGVITTISSGANLQDPGANGIVVRTAVNTTVARTLVGTANRIVITNPDGVAGAPTIDVGSTVATSGNNLSFFAATTSAQLAGVISDETGSGALVFNSSPSLTTPTIASFANAAHNHEGATGGGQLNASNVFSAGAVTIARGGTGSSLVDPGAHRLLGWDDTDNQVRFFVIGSGLSYDAGTDTLSVTVGGLGDPGANGIVARTALNTTVARTLQQPAAGFTISNPNGSGGDPTFALANDLGALEGLSGTGFAVRAAADTWANRTITGTAGQVSVADGNGASNNPVISLPTTVFLGTPGGSPAAGALTGPDASGTNVAGAPVELSGGKGTGNAVPGLVAIKYPLIGASGTTLQSLSADRFPVSVAGYTNTTVGTSINNTTTETSLFTGVTASPGSTRTIEAGSARAGTAYKILVYGAFNTTGTPTVRFKVKLGSSILADSSAYNANTNAAGVFFIEATIVVQSVGASGSVVTPFEAKTTVSTGGASTPVFAYGASGLVSVDFTANQTIDVTVQWGTASASNAAQVFAASIERIR